MRPRRPSAILALLCALVTLVTGPLAACTMPWPGGVAPRAASVAVDVVGDAEVAAPAALVNGAHHHEHGADQLPQHAVPDAADQPPHHAAPDAPNHLPPASHHEHPERCAVAVGCVTAVAPVPVMLATSTVAVSTAVPDACAEAITVARRCPEPPPPRR
jgi:hypothetical protein